MTKCWLLTLAVAGCAAGSNAPTGQTVLALGDSIAFGYNPATDKNDPSSFVSYGQLFAEASGRDIVNMACGGETSGSLISRTAPDNGCHDWRSKHPLHFDYAAQRPQDDPTLVAQIEVATAWLRDDSHAPPDVITLDIGGNDLLLFSKQCPAGDNACLQGKIPELIGTVLPKAQQNVEAAFGLIRSSGYTGKIVLVTTYALDYQDPIATFAIDDLNKILEQSAAGFDVTVADGYGAFKDAAGGGSACAAGLLYPKADGTCDIHPSVPQGAQVLANAVAAAINAR